MGASRSRPADTDPLAKALGSVFKGMNAKWWVDEIYQTLILTPTRNWRNSSRSHVDWTFWHDWFHEKGHPGQFQGAGKVPFHLVRPQGDRRYDLQRLAWLLDKIQRQG